MSIFTVRLMTKYVKETIDFLLNREEAHNALSVKPSPRCATPDPTSALA